MKQTDIRATFLTINRNGDLSISGPADIVPKQIRPGGRCLLDTCPSNRDRKCEADPMTTDTKPEPVADRDRIAQELDLALRVEDAIRSLDIGMRDDDRWFAAVHQWRRCVSEFGPGSHAANGALLGIVEIAWSDDVTVTKKHDRYRVTIGSVEIAARAGSSRLMALAVALEECP